jgi:hypothetical protein
MAVLDVQCRHGGVRSYCVAVSSTVVHDVQRTLSLCLLVGRVIYGHIDLTAGDVLSVMFQFAHLNN